jgi:small-conductance mechanosensitive channel
MALAAQGQIGSARLSLGEVLLFVAAMWGSYLISHTLRFVLREEVYPRMMLAPGLHYSISLMVHYAILILGFFIALALVGFPLTHLTILAGALSVGLGFGLQNVVNNFVSGIILLFERPVKVGDVILVSGAEGVVTRIGIRASVVRSIDGSEIIVPNGNFISNEVTNLTLSVNDLVINILVSVAPGIDANEMIQLLKNAAAAHPQILKEPAPQALLLNFSNASLNFELRAFVSQSANWMGVRSDLSLAISAALTAKNFTLK